MLLEKVALNFSHFQSSTFFVLEIVMNLYIGWLMLVFLSLEKFCRSKPWFSLLRLTPDAFPWFLSTLPSFVLFELTRKISPPTKKGHTPSLTELRKKLHLCQFSISVSVLGWDAMGRKWNVFHLNAMKNFFAVRVTENQNRFPREIVDSSSLEIVKSHLGTILSSTLQGNLLEQGGWTD